MNPVIFFTTVENKRKAQSIGNHLVKNRLAACVNIISNIESIYHWKDQLQQDTEFLLMIKSDASKKENIQKIFDNYHPYDLPELIMVTIDDGSIEYLEWMKQNICLVKMWRLLGLTGKYIPPSYAHYL